MTTDPRFEHPVTGARMAGDTCYCRECYEKVRNRYLREVVR